MKQSIPAMFACLAVLFWTGPIAADSLEDQAAATAEALYAAIATGDSEKVSRILAPDVLVFESGGIEGSLAEYASHHMPADMEFLAGMQREVLERQVSADDKMAVVSTRSRLSGRFRDQDIDLFSTETLVMKATEDGWRVEHIHWSSSPAN